MIFETTEPGMSTFPVILDELRRMNFALQEQRADHMHYYSRCVAALEFQTVRLDCGRQTGKTSYILNNAKQGDIIITMSVQHAHCWNRSVVMPCGVIAISETSRINPIQITGTVWVDEASHCVKDRRDLDSLYMVFAGHAKQFVLLG